MFSDEQKKNKKTRTLGERGMHIFNLFIYLKKCLVLFIHSEKKIKPSLPQLLIGQEDLDTCSGS